MEQLKLIPYPTSVEIFDGNLDCKEICLAGEPCFALDFFKDFAQKNSLILSDSGVKIQYLIGGDLAIDEEGYFLEISQDGIDIKAKCKKGLNYAFCSLVHLFSNYDGVLPYCKIKDEPYLKFRGMLLDNGRYFFPVEEVLKYVDFCFLNKLNVLHWHLTDDQG
ncbi:MAG: family 20 glycosylhydrolase, partial [Clostridia bacterium]|nr:family 20 glycosylhydrolase [Clostridia bacterium]